MSETAHPNELSKEEIRQLEAIHFPGTPKIINNSEQLSESLSYLNRQDVLGFDTETRPSFKVGEWHPVALLQLATHEEAHLFRLTSLGLPKPLKELLSNPKVVKAGLALDQDLKGLKQLSDFNPAGFEDLASMAKAAGFKSLGLRSLTGTLLNMRLTKGAKITNWERDPLSEKQIRYAATDAWVSLKLYDELKKLQ